MAIIASVLGIVGIFMIIENYTGQVVVDVEADNLQIISMKEIQEHNSVENCWIINNRYVYDVTMFLSIYPESEELGNNCGGQEDISSLPETLQGVMQEYKIGKIK